MDKKKLNTWIFVAVATVLNIALTLVLLIVGYIGIILLRNAVGAERMNANVLSLLFIADIIGSIILSYVIYQAVLKLLNKKIDFDAHFDPIFKPRGGKK